MSDRMRIVTPDTDPDRWLPEEVELFRAGRCSWQTGYGNWGETPSYCGRPSRNGASFGHCPEHEAELQKDHWPDGTRR